MTRVFREDSLQYDSIKAQYCLNTIERMWEISRRDSDELDYWIKYYRTLSPLSVSNDQLFAEICWIVYCSGFRFTVLKRYWPSIKRAYHDFEVERVAHSRSDLSESARKVCRISSFNNIKKARWCLYNARRLLALDSELELEGGLQAHFARLANLPLNVIVSEAPQLVQILGFKGIGQTTIFHLLKNMGLDTFKPDIHVRRTLSNMDLISSDHADLFEIARAMMFLSKIAKRPVRDLDTLLFFYGQLTKDRIISS